MKETKVIAILGTGSDVGKSVVATAFNRLLSNAGKPVAPFKAQNMSNNSFVTKEGGEMGRAQVVQAEAARVTPHTDMNPVLLKPSADNTSQVILHGKAIANKESSEYWKNTDYLFRKASESLERLKQKYNYIIIEGAGSCAEVNLRDTDFVNFKMAHHASADVILVADIDRGGVFAQIIGTLKIITPKERSLVKGIIINKFRGDSSLFTNGIKYIEEQTGVPVLGLIPYYRHIDIDSEDGVILDSKIKTEKTFEHEKINIGVFKLPHISNFTDFSPLQRNASVELTYLYTPKNLDEFDLIIIPGTKNVRFDIEWMRKTGWEEILLKYSENFGNIIGICGGFQMLGTIIKDPYGLEGKKGETKGLNLLDIETTLDGEKTLSNITGKYLPGKIKVTGYEIHLGKTLIGEHCEPLIMITEKNGNPVKNFDGTKNKSGNIWGCYIHGIFDGYEFRNYILKQIKPYAKLYSKRKNDTKIEKFKNSQYDLLAKHFESNMNMKLVNELLGIV